MNQKQFVTRLLIVFTLLIFANTCYVVALWQLEAIWWVMNKREPYVIPFNSHKTVDYWYWHDVWYVVDCVTRFLSIALTFWLGWRLKGLLNGEYREA